MTRLAGTPSLLVSTLASCAMRLDAYDAAAAHADLAGIDLDATNELRRMLIGSRSMHRALAHPGVRSIWLRPIQLETSGLVPFREVVRVSGATALPLLVIDVPNGVDSNDALSLQLGAAEKVRAAVGSDVPIAIAIRAENQDGSHDHLDRLHMIRYHVSEWDLKLALDLTCQTDGSWEAEAAMNRILPRTALIRITVPRTFLSGGTRWRIASRVIAAATDSGFRGYLSVAPELSLWEKRSVTSLADRSAIFAENVERRAVRVQNERLRTHIRRQFR
jgi:hypothetical protein